MKMTLPPAYEIFLLVKPAGIEHLLIDLSDPKVSFLYLWNFVSQILVSYGIIAVFFIYNLEIFIVLY